MPTIFFKDWDRRVDVKGGTILDAALKQDLPFPFACRVGECGTCKSRLLSGDVDYGEYVACALVKTEREQGYVLACRSRPVSDVTVELAQAQPADKETCFGKGLCADAIYADPFVVVDNNNNNNKRSWLHRMLGGFGNRR